MNPASPEGHSALSVVWGLLEWNWDEALRETRVAIELSPNDAEIANFAGDKFRMFGDLDSALKWERRVVELDPLLPVNHADLGWALIEVPRCDEALAPLEKALELDPDLAQSLDALGRAYICLGESAKAWDAAERLARLDPESSRLLKLQALVAIEIRRRNLAASPRAGRNE